MDPALWELLRVPGGGDQVEAIIRLASPDTGVPGVRLVARFGPVATCRLERDAIPAVREDERVVSLKAPRPLGPEPLPPVGADRAAGSSDGLGDLPRREAHWPTGAGVVVGIVDWGCDFDHPNLKHADGSTRLRALWDQRATPTGPGPRPYGYGRVHCRRQIDQALRASDPYEALNYHPADADRDGSGAHGTHVTDIAAGNGLAGGPTGVAPQAELVFVHLADRGTGGLASLGDSVRILEAVDFVSRVAADRPWVVNLSLGRHGGPHDGSTLVEMALDAALLSAPGRCCVVSAGNYFEKATHTCGRLRPGGTEVLRFTTMEADLTPNELEVWYPGWDEVAVQLEPPSGEPTRWISLGERVPIRAGGRPVGRLYHRPHDPNNDDNHIDLFLDAWAPAGLWTLRIAPRKVRDGSFHAWLERDEACASCQARFATGESDPSTSTGTLANGALPLVVGAYDPSSPSRAIARFSSSGPTRDGRPKPDLLAPGVGILAARSAPLGAARSPGASTRKSGTSMAAPHVTGAVALCLQATPRTLSAAEIRALVLGAADQGSQLPEDAARRGRGYLDIGALVADLASLARVRQPRPAPRSIDAKEPLMEPTARRPVLLPMRPDRLYREIAYSDGRGLPPPIDASFVVLARPGERPAAEPAAGDVLVRVALGEPGRGYVAVLAGPAAVGRGRVGSRRRAEHGGPGFYADIVNRKAAHQRGRPARARRVLDPAGRMPHGQLLLRPKPSGEPDPQPDDGSAEDRPPVTVDVAAAVPPFVTTERTNVVLPLLTPKRSADAIAWTAKVHDSASGVTVAEIEAALTKYVDRTAVETAIADHNKAHPTQGINPGTRPGDAAFVEMVHQFQAKCYAEPAEHDGRAGESTLDSLGLIARTAKSFNRADRANANARKRLQARRSKVASAGGGEFTADNWFDHMVDPSFLGRRTKLGHGIHVVLARKLRLAERHLLTLAEFRGMTPTQLGRALGISENHGGARPTQPTSASMHTFGLAMDIAYTANPWVRQDTSWRALQHAALLVSGVALPQRTASIYFDSIGKDATRSTGSKWDEIRQRSDELATYLRLADDPAALAGILQARQAAGTTGVFRPGESLDAVAERWRGLTRRDRRDLETGDFRNHRAPTSGFLSLPRQLVIALRDHACLTWGAIDLGPDPRGRLTGSGDVMHFDARTDGVGAVVAAGVQPIPEAGHPCRANGSVTPTEEGLAVAAGHPSLLGADPHGEVLAQSAELSTRLSRRVSGGSPSDDDLAEFDAPEHGFAGRSVQAMLDSWALNALIDGGAFIDTGATRTWDKRDRAIADWRIFTPTPTSTASGRLETYPDLGSKAHPDAHWYYIAPDPIGPGGGWTPATLKRALLAGEAVALSPGHIILLAGDLYESFDELTGRGQGGGRPRPAVNLMTGIDTNEPWAYVLLSLRQFPEFDWAIDQLAALTLMRTVAQNYSDFERELQEGGRERFQRTRSLARFLRAARGPTRFSEAHLLSRVLEIGGTVSHHRVANHAPWLPAALVPAEGDQFQIGRDPFSIAASDGHYLDLALRNSAHFAPANWSTFEAYQRQALAAIGQHMARPREATVTNPIPADAVAMTAFGCHFLSDAFASGHMRTPVAQLGMRGALGSKIMHDFDNSYGLLVQNGLGRRWRAFGDEYLRPAAPTGWGEVQQAVLHQLAPLAAANGLDVAPDANRDRMIEAVGAAFKQLHYEAQRLRRSRPGGQFDAALSQNRGTSADRLVGDDRAPGRPHDAPTLTGRIEADVEERIRYLRKHEPHHLPAGTDPRDVLRNHPPLFVRDTAVRQGDIAVVPRGSPYRWFTREFRGMGEDRFLRLRWHGRTLEYDFSEFFHLEDVLGRRRPPWQPVAPDAVLRLVRRDLSED